jgi:hypothetical protein
MMKSRYIRATSALTALSFCATAYAQVTPESYCANLPPNSCQVLNVDTQVAQAIPSGAGNATMPPLMNPQPLVGGPGSSGSQNVAVTQIWPAGTYQVTNSAVTIQTSIPNGTFNMFFPPAPVNTYNLQPGGTFTTTTDVQLLITWNQGFGGLYTTTPGFISVSSGGQPGATLKQAVLIITKKFCLNGQFTVEIFSVPANTPPTTQLNNCA